MDNALKRDAVISLYHNCYEHIRHIKSNQWQVTMLIVALVFAVNGVARLAIEPPEFVTHIRIALTLFTVFTLAYGVWHLSRLQRELSWQREIRFKIENKIFKFTTEGEYIEGDTLFDSDFDMNKQMTPADVAKFLSWVIIIGITAIFTLYSIWYLASAEKPYKTFCGNVRFSKSISSTELSDLYGNDRF